MAKIVIVGAGIVGLCCARSALADGHLVTVVDPEPHGDKASFGNAGGIAITEIIPASTPAVFARLPGWLLDPLGPVAVRPQHLVKLLPFLWRFARSSSQAEVSRITKVLAGLLASAAIDIGDLLTEMDLSHDLQRAGALWVYRNAAAFERDGPDRELRRSFGIVLDEMDGCAARALEPSLGPSVLRAVLAPQWSHLTDPRRLTVTLQKRLEANGVNFERQRALAVRRDILECEYQHISFDHLVIAAGAWSGQLARSVGDRVLLESERGYNLTLPHPGIDVTRELIFAEDAFVATPMDMGLRIGGAAEFAGLDAPPDFRRSDALARRARAYLPDLNLRGGAPWAGHRPATPDSLPVLGQSPRRSDVIYAFGHGHCGLTMAPTTGRLVADIIAGRPTSVDLSPCSISRFGA
ncbi:NAD(P)/FAD-dependent oxidoreductase [Bosea beijingensis]|uniref:NAD(P)/FAD-dependent oxidoreductase n=1 Tax=Bosea beijingensis TaxID=3068632 RepID=UPI0027422135|nr:FAD-binding oxidoreductase [Bosea sp. REN20]